VSSDELAVPLPDSGRVVTHWPIPIVVQRGALVLVGLIVALAAAFALIYCVAAGRAFPSFGDILWGLAAALIWPVAAVLHECAHAVTGAVAGRPPVWARIGLVPGVALTPPPVERRARILVSGSGPVLELAVDVVCILISAGTGAQQFLTHPLAMAGGVCALKGWRTFCPGHAS
jgi:hypothetical protein